VLPFLGTGASGGNGLLILGNPDLGNRNLDLPGAEQEAKVLERINRGARVLLRSQATETALRKFGPQYREIHFAMHGKFDSSNAMSSGLYMAKDAENDGVLSVSELYDLQLNADLVVLSACETALGDTSKGNDVVGLNRGFLFAGARSIVSSLWEVDDNATRDLMVAFYQQRARHGKAGGLRQAQLATLKKYPHPYYWAAFQMSGLF
jgi:CHAT domain-containing protein